MKELNNACSTIVNHFYRDVLGVHLPTGEYTEKEVLEDFKESCPEIIQLLRDGVSYQKQKTIDMVGDKLTGSMTVARIYGPKFLEEKREVFTVLLLDSKNRIEKEVVISIGSLNSSIVHPREVFKPAIAASAAAVVLIHNHPSGDPEPSQDDRTITKRLIDAGKILGIMVLDHIVLGSGGLYYSFLDHGEMKGGSD